MTVSRLIVISFLAIGSGALALEPGEMVPGPFQAYMATGPRAGRFHSPVTEFGLSPAVVILVRENTEFEKPLVDLLKKLDPLIPKYLAANFGATAIVIGDGGYRKAIQAPVEDKQVTELTLTNATLAKEAKEAKLRDLAKRENLQNVTLGFADPDELSKYGLDANSAVTVLLLNQQKVVAKSVHPTAALAEPEVAKFLQQVEATADAVAKASRKQ